LGRSQRQKGAVAEREVAAILQEWWRKLEPGCRFVRTPSSGGWHGREGAGVRGDFRASGDLMTTARRFPFTVEVKRREGWSDKGFLAGGRSPVWEWWTQAQAQADEHKSSIMAAKNEGMLGVIPDVVVVPMLVFRRSNEHWRVLVPEDWWRRRGFALWRASREWKGRWPRKRGHRPVCHYLLQMTGIHPRCMAGESDAPRSVGQEEG
jgi:hypothetical protein